MTATGLAVIVALTVLVCVSASCTARLAGRGRAVVTAIIVWQAAVWSALASVLFAIALLFATPLEIWLRSGTPFPFDALLAACHHHAGSIIGAAGHPELLGVGLPALAALGGARLLLVATRRTLSLRRQRARHFQAACLSATQTTRLSHDLRREIQFVVPSRDRAAFCIPGTDAVVITQAAIDSLTTEEREAVVAHERAHLKGRHHLIISSVAVLRRTFPFVGFLRVAESQVRRLVEMRADDVAAGQVGRTAVASAIRTLAPDTHPGGSADRAVLAANDGTAAEARIDRLTSPRLTLRGRIEALGLVLSGTTLVAVTPVLGIAIHSALC